MKMSLRSLSSYKSSSSYKVYQVIKSGLIVAGSGFLPTGAVHLFNILFLSLHEQYTFLIFLLVPRKISKEGLARWVPSHLSPHKISEEGFTEWVPSHSSPRTETF